MTDVILCRGNRLHAVEDAIVRYWQVSRQDRDLPRWTACTGLGRLENAAAQALADRVWPQACQPVRHARAAQTQGSLELA